MTFHLSWKKPDAMGVSALSRQVCDLPFYKRGFVGFGSALDSRMASVCAEAIDAALGVGAKFENFVTTQIFMTPLTTPSRGGGGRWRVLIH